LLNFTFWIALPAVAVYVGVCALVFVAMHLMSAEMKTIDSDRGKSAIAAAVESLVVGLAESAADEATWTEAYINTYVEPNPAWLDSAWGATARISDTYDTAILTDMNGNIVFGETSRGPVTGTLGDLFSGVPQLFERLESGIARVGDDATVSNLSRNARGASCTRARGLRTTWCWTTASPSTSRPAGASPRRSTSARGSAGRARCRTCPRPRGPTTSVPSPTC